MDTVTIDLDNKEEVRYGKFWRRLGALLLDGLIVGVPIGLVSFYNQTEMKSVAVLVVVSLIQLAYKPVMEFAYGTTLGKMAAGLRVVNLNMEKPDLGAALLRNIFAIVYGLVTVYLSSEAYTDPEFLSASGWQESGVALAKASAATSYLGYVYFAIVLIDMIIMLVDQKAQSLHDKIASTYVIRTQSGF